MRFIPPMPRFLRRKATVFALVAGISSAYVCWTYLPPRPRYEIQLPVWPDRRPTFSADFHYAAISSSSSETAIWDIRADKKQFSFKRLADSPRVRDYNQAFAADGSNFVEFFQGQAIVRDVQSGRIKQKLIFPYEDERSTDSFLFPDANGNLWVIVKEKEKPWTVRDLFTGEEVCSIMSTPANKDPEQNPAFWFDYSGQLFFRNPATRKLEARVFPTGRVLFELPESATPNSLSNWRVSRDGKTQVEITSEEIVVRDPTGSERHMSLPSLVGPILSHDGKHLSVMRTQYMHKPDFLPAWIWQQIEYWRQSSFFALYDLASETEIASFPSVGYVHFSKDNHSFAVVSNAALAIYDLPVKKSWARVILFAMGAASAVFLCGWLLGLRRRAAGVSPLIEQPR